MKKTHLFCTAASALLACFMLLALSACNMELRKYKKETGAVLQDLLLAAGELDELMKGLDKGAVAPSDFDSKLSAYEKKLETIKGRYTAIMPPVEMDTVNRQISKAIASESTGITALKSHSSRKKMYTMLENKVRALKEEEPKIKADLQKNPNDEVQNRLAKLGTEVGNLGNHLLELNKEMEGQIAYFKDNHQFFLKSVELSLGKLR